jgi:hypothetical protein
MLHALPNEFRSLTIASFDRYLGEEFEVDSKPLAVGVRLDRLVKYDKGPGFLTREPFRLIWSTALRIDMALGTYRLRRRGWGPHQVYLEPVGMLDERRLYQSVFF